MNNEQESPKLVEGEQQEKKRGGWRPGAGRPPGSLKEENRIRLELKRQWLTMVQENATAIFQTQLMEALGIYVETTNKDGTVRIYKTKPNPMSLAWMLEHVWGRAPQKMILEGSLETKDVLSPEAQALIKAAMKYALPKDPVTQSAANPEAAGGVSSGTGENKTG